MQNLRQTFVTIRLPDSAMPLGKKMEKLIDALEAWHKKEDKMVRWRHFLE